MSKFVIVYIIMHVQILLLTVQWLEEEFIPYLDAWEKSVEAREGFTKTQKKLMMLSPETSKGLRITGKHILLLPTLYFYSNTCR